jgi:acetylglutamate kinase
MKKKVFDNSLFVIKISGKISMKYEYLHNVLKQVKYLIDTVNGLKIILVIGFGKPVDDLLQKLYNKQSIKIDGKRVTDVDEIEVIKMISGLNIINASSILVKLNVFHHLMPIVHPDYIISHKREIREHDFKYVGDIKSVNGDMLLDLLKDRDVLVTSSMLFDYKSSDVLNINADSLATDIAINTNAKKLIFVSDVNGVYDNSKNIIPKIHFNEIDSMIEDKVVTDGMLPKMNNIKKALLNGLDEVSIISGYKDELSKEIDRCVGTYFTNED